MLKTLITNTYAVPSLVLMFPVEAKGLFDKARSIFQKEMCVMFVCPVTKKPAKSGPNGLGYRVRVTKEWVKKAAPVLIIALKIAQLAINAYGIPFPLPSLPLDMFQTDLLNLVSGEIENQFEEELKKADANEVDEQITAYCDVKDALDTAESETQIIRFHSFPFLSGCVIALYCTVLYCTVLYCTSFYSC